MNTEITYYTYYEAPIGKLLLTSDGTSLTRLYMRDVEQVVESAGDWQRQDDATPFDEARRQLDAYFAGTLTDFDTDRMPLSSSGTGFQQKVWNELCAIPYGETISYGELAKRIGDPNASRAVGLANGNNPISIIVPCHRVIGANGKLTGYGGGLSRKKLLLDWEKGVAKGTPLPWDKIDSGELLLEL